MSEHLNTLIECQLERMRELRDDTRDIAATVADEVWDKFEVDIEEATEDGYMFDFAKSTQSSLASLLALAYDEAFERHVSALFSRHENEMLEASAGQEGFDAARIDLAGLRKGLKLRRHADELIAQAINRAKPGLLGMLFLATDPCSEAWDREHRDNARRLRRELLALRDVIVGMIGDETSATLQATRLAYASMLHALSGRRAGIQASASVNA